MWTLLVTVALAAGPTAVITEEGAVIGSAHLDAPADEVRAALSDPHFVNRIHAGGTTVTLVSREGECEVLDYVSPNAIMTARYRVKRCVPKTGSFGATLISSNTFTSYSTMWTITPSGSGVDVTYRLYTEPKVLIPASIVRRASRSSIDDLMKKLAEHFAR